jgi:hypothetical protein
MFELNLEKPCLETFNVENGYFFSSTRIRSRAPKHQN